MSHACGWIIDKDLLFEAEPEEGEELNFVPLFNPLRDEAGTVGPGDGTDDTSLMTVPFRLYDDDGELFYEGRMTPKCFDHFGECDPLHAFGMPNAGATELRYLEDGKWKQL